MMELWISFNYRWMIILSFVFFIFLIWLLAKKIFLYKFQSQKFILFTIIFRNTAIITIALIVGWAAHSNYTYFNSPNYKLYDIFSKIEFDEIVKPIPINSINIDSEPKFDYTAFYTSDNPFIVIVRNFEGLIFCPPRPENEGFAGIVPIHQINLRNPDFKLLALMESEIQLFFGTRKDDSDSKDEFE